MFTVDHHNKAGLLTFKETLHHDPRTRVAKLVIGEHVVDGRLGLMQCHGNDHAFACGEAVGLDDDRRSLFPDIAERGLYFGKHGVGGRGDVVSREEVLGKGLTALKLSGAGCRSAAAIKRLMPASQRRWRWSR